MNKSVLGESDIKRYGEELFHGMTTGKTVPPLTKRIKGMSIQDAYHISLHYLSLRIDRNNEQVVGKKIGVTSEAVQSMLDVREPDFGFLTDAMQFAEGDIPIGHLIQPRAEAEIAFLLKEDLVGEEVSAKDVLAATEAVMACFEIVDSRIHNWQIRIQDTIADNASCGVFVISDQQVDPRTLDLSAAHVRVNKNGQFLSEGLSSAVQGSPLQAVAWLANTLGGFDMALKAGDVILSGSLVPLEPIRPGDRMTMDIPGIGSLAVNFIDAL